MHVLGIETSCDETAAAIVRSDRTVLANCIWSQIAEHAPYGGVVPEVAARSHMEHLERVIHEACDSAKLTLRDIDAVAVTGGPGLIGGVIVGVMMAKAIASVQKKPFIAVNHLEGHALTVRLTHDVAFPYLMLLVSGGHCQFIIVRGLGDYVRLGGTMDDALGEAFDKSAKLIGLGYPGGPAVEKLARAGNPRAYSFPIPLRGRPGCDFSFSGLKTAVRMQVEALKTENSQELSEQLKADICASFQYCATQSIIERTRNAMSIFRDMFPQGNTMVLAGGVAANQYIRVALEEVLGTYHCQLVAPPIALCTDNAAMIAWAGIERLQAGERSGMDFEPRARWPLAAA
jgi:N6-L-threonylcarbamoyladenine synthase